MRKILAIALALCALSTPAGSQNAITQEGTVLQNSPMMFRGNNRARQGAPVQGAPTGQTVTTGDSVVGGRCDYSAPIDDPNGYTFVCIDGKGNEIVSGGTKLPSQPFTIVVNGTRYEMPFNVALIGSDAVVGDLSGLKSVAGAPGKRITRLGYSMPGDGGLAMYNWSITNCAAPDNGAQVQPTGVTGCWMADFSSREVDPRVWGQICGMAGDAKPAMQAAATYLATSGGGSLKISCPVRLNSTVTLGAGTRLTSSLPVYYPGQTNVPGPAVWPPATGNAVNCYSTTLPCIAVGGEGVEIDHINFGNPQSIPPSSGTWTPTSFPFVISTDGNVSWQGLSIHDVSFTAASRGIDLQGTPDYAVYAGAQIKVDHVWCNPCLETGIRMQRIDNPIRVSNFESTPSWYLSYVPVGEYLRSHAVGFDILYAAAPLFDNITFFALKEGIRLRNSDVSNNFGSLNFAMSAGRMTNMFFNQVCQAVTAPNGNGTIAAFDLVNSYFWGDQTGFGCSNGKAMLDLKSNTVNIGISQAGVGYIDTFINAGCGAACNPGGGAIVRINDIDVAGYSWFTTGQDFLKSPVGSFISFGTTPLTGIRPKAGGGKLMGPGLDGTTAFMQPISVGGGFVPSEGSVLLEGGAANAASGYVSFWNTLGQQMGFMGGCASGAVSPGCQVAVASGAFYIKPRWIAAGSPVVKFDASGTNNIVNMRPLPTSCTGLETGTLWVDTTAASVLKVCP